MECPRCGAANDTDVGSCLSCGAQMPAGKTAAGTSGKTRLAAGAAPKQCPNCMTLNAATFKFCARCGTPLGAGAPQASAPPSKPAAPRSAAPTMPSAPAKKPGPAPGAARPAAPLAQPPAPSGPAAAAAAPPRPAALSKPVAPSAAAKPPAPAVRPPAPAAGAPKPAAPNAPAARPTPARPAPPPPPKPVAAPRPAPPPPKPAAAPRPRARLSAIARDGSRSADFLLVKDETRVGREVGDGDVKLDKDPFIAPVHAVFRFEGPQLVVQDGGSANGVFLWLKERSLDSGDELRIGRQRLRVEWMPEEPEQLADQPIWGSPDPGYTARVVQLLEGGGEGDIFPLRTGDNSVGRASGDVSFPQDGYVSSRHATITVSESSLSVKDLGSANGTFVRVNGQAAVTAGDLLLVGEQILRVDPA